MTPEDQVGAALALARAPARHHLAWGLEALEAALSERPDLSAPWLPFDLLALLVEGGLSGAAAPAEPALRDALRGWEDHVLSRLLADVRWGRVSDAWGGLPPALRPRAAGLLAARVDQALGGAHGEGLSVATVRRLREAAAAELAAQGRRALAEGLADVAAEALRQAARRARGGAALLTDADVALVERFEALEALGARVLLAQLALEAQEQLTGLPARPRHGARQAEALTRLDDASEYPMGGFAELTTRGTPENLVPAELAGLDDHERPDLFDVRYVENELLFYARDEGVALRRRRSVALVVDPSVSALRVVEPGRGVQRLVVALGMLSAVLRRVLEWLDPGTVRFALVFPHGADEAPFAEEARVLELLLHAERERGAVEVLRCSPAALEERLEAALGPGAARVRLVAGAGAEDTAVVVGDASLSLVVEGRVQERGDWTTVGRALAEHLVR